MKRMILSAVSAALLILSVAVCCQAAKGETMDVKGQLGKFADVKLGVDGSLLDKKQRKLVDELVEAARYLDEIFLRQAWHGNVVLRDELKKKGGAEYKYFVINSGPFDRIDHEKPFIAGISAKPKGAGFYPEDLTKEEFEKWIKAHPDDREPFESPFTVIKRENGKLVAIPYSVEYKEFLEPAAKHMKKAAEYSDNESLKKYLISRADALLSNKYYDSDVDWVRMTGHAIEVVIGPYEVYEDNLFGFKAAYEAFITRVDPKESERLAKVVSYLDELEKNLPLEENLKGRGRNLTSPIVVAYEIYTAGDAKRGVQTLAFNLPNDEVVRAKEGSKKVMLKNVSNAKFDKILIPIANRAIAKDLVKDVNFDAFFGHTLLHEVSHGIGPGEIVKNGKKTTVNKELKNLYSIIEEAKADTLGVYNNAFLIEKGLYPKDFGKVLWPTYLAGIFRSIRFGINEAHGGANSIQLNYLMEKGGITFDKGTGLFGLNMARMPAAIKDLAHDLLVIEARGDFEAGKKFVEKYRHTTPETKSTLAKLNDVPVDIWPEFEYR